MFPIESFQKTVLKLTGILNLMEIPFHLTGGVTGVAYGEPRLTQDIHIVIQNAAVATQRAEFLNKLAESDFLHDVDAVCQAIENKKMFQLFDSQESLKLDMYIQEKWSPVSFLVLKALRSLKGNGSLSCAALTLPLPS